MANLAKREGKEFQAEGNSQQSPKGVSEELRAVTLADVLEVKSKGDQGPDAMGFEPHDKELESNGKPQNSREWNMIRCTLKTRYRWSYQKIKSSSRHFHGHEIPLISKSSSAQRLHFPSSFASKYVSVIQL